MWLVEWLIARWIRVWEIFESWYYKIQNIFHFWWTQVQNVVHDWWGAAYQFFHTSLSWLQDVVLGWYYRIRAAVYDYWTKLWQALTATWGYIWDNFYEGYKSIIDYTYSARLDIQDTFTRFKWEFQAFRADPSQYIYDRIPQWAKDTWNNAKTWWDWLKWRWDAFTAQIGLLLDNPSQYIYDRIPLWIKQIWWNASTWWTWLQGRWDAFTAQIGLFLDNPSQYIYDRIPLWIKQIWWNAETWWDWLSLRWDDFTREVGAFIDDPYGYITALLEAWIQLWAEAIGNTIADIIEWLILLITGLVWGLLEGTKNWFIGYIGYKAEHWWTEEWIEEGRYRLFGAGADAPGGYKFWANYWYEKTYALPPPPLPRRR